MMIVVITLRYEYAVPVCREVDDALAVLAVSCIVVTLLALLIGVAVFIGGDSVCRSGSGSRVSRA